MTTSEWGIYVVDEVRAWVYSLEPAAKARVVLAIDALAESGPSLGRPLVDTITHSSLANLKELRPGTMRILFVFDPWRSQHPARRRRQGRAVGSLVSRGDTTR